MLLCNKWGHPGWYRTTVLLGSFSLDSFPWWKVKGTQCFPGWNGGHFTRHFTAKKRWQAPHRAHSEIKLFFVSRLLVNNFRVKPVHKPSLFLAERPHICSLQERAGRKCLNTNSNGSSADGGRGCNLAWCFLFPLCLTLTVGLFLVLWEFCSIMMFPLLLLLAKFISPSLPNQPCVFLPL